MAGKQQYKRLAETKITGTRHLVISETESGDILLAQKTQIVENGKTTDMFMTGAIKLDADKLIDVRDAINEALELL